ncbi:uncharacterized protein [Hoplias malabaricus]|uniref:uncharacterized protein isoform X2 n=1 Tax=Hoplias malabaricus TaxID=27720 RepID=UPI0034631B04
MKCAGETFISCKAFYETGQYARTFKISFSLKRFLLSAAIFSLTLDLCFCACARAEYEINGECCPMCAPGNRVFTHCTIETSTTCVPCPESTYTDAPNGLIDCLACSVCDDGQGLEIKSACIRSSNTVCEPLDGYYCIDQLGGNCLQATEHKECSPGQYIKQRGTLFTDTECADCSDYTFSNGSLQICQPHTGCEDLGLKEIKAGTNSTDAECGNKTSSGLIAGAAFSTFIIVAVVAAAAVMFHKKKSLKNDNMELEMAPHPPHRHLCCHKAGNRVSRHCTEDTTTTCVPCLDSTYLDAPNGLSICFNCTVCDPSQGLRVKTSCTRESDTVFEPLDGHYCLEKKRISCSLAAKHTPCLPGQYIKQRGTAFTDTKCAECSDDTYSNGSLQICQTHTQCEDLGLTEIKAGTNSTDAECGNKTSPHLIAGVTISIFIIVAVVAAVMFHKQNVHLSICSALKNDNIELGLGPVAPSSEIPMLIKSSERQGTAV